MWCESMAFAVVVFSAVDFHTFPFFVLSQKNPITGC